MSIMMMAMLACSLSAQDLAVEQFTANLLSKYPKARLLDIYKSCFQDYMGAEHLINDTASVKAYLEQELETTGIEDLLPWYYEPCGINGNYVRMSLRAVIEGRITADALFNAFVDSANGGSHPDVKQWAKQWHDIVSTIDDMEVSLPNYNQDKEFIEQVLSQGKYAISHSPEYREAYAPHYRIVKREIFEQELKPLLP